MKPRVFMTCVGDRDPYYERPRTPFDPQKTYNETEPQVGKGPILSFLDESTPPLCQDDYLYLIPTRKDQNQPNADLLKRDTYRGAQATGEKIQKIFGVIPTYKPLCNLDPTDFEMLIPQMRRLIHEIVDEAPQDAEFIVFISSGTPQMQSAWYVLAHEGTLPAGTRLYYRAAEDTPIREVHLEPLFEQESKRLAIEQALQFNFQAAASTLNALAQRALETQRKQRAALFAQLYNAYHDRLLFHYQEAYQWFEAVLNNGNQAHLQALHLQDLVTQQKDMLQELHWVRADISLEIRAVDLYHSAYLHLKVGRYSDSIWRAASCYEQVLVDRTAETLRAKILGNYRPDPYAFRKSLFELYQTSPKLRTNISNFVRKIYNPKPQVRQILNKVPLFLGIEEARKILDPYKNNFDPGFVERAQENLLYIRNNAMHRAEPVSEAEAKRGLEMAYQALIKQFGSGVQKMIKNYSLSVEKFQWLAKVMEQHL